MSKAKDTLQTLLSFEEFYSTAEATAFLKEFIERIEVNEVEVISVLIDSIMDVGFDKKIDLTDKRQFEAVDDLIKISNYLEKIVYNIGERGENV